MDQECKYLIPTSMESSLFLILQTLAGTGMNKLLTVNTSKSGLGDTFPSNIKLFWWQERLLNPTFKAYFKFTNVTLCVSREQELFCQTQWVSHLCTGLTQGSDFPGKSNIWAAAGCVLMVWLVSAGEHLESSGINGTFPTQWVYKNSSLSTCSEMVWQDQKSAWCSQKFPLLYPLQ